MSKTLPPIFLGFALSKINWMTFNLKYFAGFIALLIVEVGIAKYTTGFIRNTLGDFLVVILLYFFIKSFIKNSVKKIAILVIFIAYVIEFLQLSDLQNFYPEKFEKTLKIILGTSFSFGDLVAYTLCFFTIIFFEKK